MGYGKVTSLSVPKKEGCVPGFVKFKGSNGATGPGLSSIVPSPSLFSHAARTQIVAGSFGVVVPTHGSATIFAFFSHKVK